MLKAVTLTTIAWSAISTWFTRALFARAITPTIATAVTPTIALLARFALTIVTWSAFAIGRDERGS